MPIQQICSSLFTGKSDGEMVPGVADNDPLNTFRIQNSVYGQTGTE